jgi:hypothetical protein
VNLFPIFIIKLISGLLSIGHYSSFPSATAILTGYTKKVVPARKSSLRYEWIKNK